MEWYLIAFVMGAIVAPWGTMGPALRIAFAKGIQEGLGVWSGVALITTPVVFVVMLLGSYVIG